MNEAYTRYTWLSTQRPMNINQQTVFQEQNQLPPSFQNGIGAETYSGPVTLSLPQWQNYVAAGYNTLLGSGGVIPGGTYSGTVYRGHVRVPYGWGV